MTVLSNLFIILQNTRFPENIGMAARACANMGCPNLLLVKPERWNLRGAESTATSAGLSVLRNACLFPDISKAISNMNGVYGTTARLGGMRKIYDSPWLAAEKILGSLNLGENIAILFGPEDRGLSNEELSLCDGLIHIPSALEASSLNLAQSVLIALYECRKAASANAGRAISAPIKSSENTLKKEDMQRLEGLLKTLLIDLDCLNGKNAGYFFLQWHQLLSRVKLRRHEYDSLLGVIRQIKLKLRQD